MKQLTNTLTFICAFVSVLSSQSIRIDSTVEIRGNVIIKEDWDYQTDLNFEYTRIEYTDDVETEYEYKQFVDSLNVKKEVHSDVQNYEEKTDQQFDGEGRILYQIHQFFRNGTSLIKETRNVYEFSTGDELESQRTITRSGDSTILGTSDSRYFYDANNRVEQIIRSTDQKNNGDIWRDTLNFFYLNDSVVRIDMNSGFDGIPTSREFQRIYQTNYTMNLGGDTIYIYNSETRQLEDSTVFVDETEIQYTWGVGKKYENNGSIRSEGINTLAQGMYEEFLNPIGDTLLSSTYTVLFIDGNYTMLNSNLENSELLIGRKYFFNNRGKIEYEEDYIDSPWGQIKSRTKRYYYSETVSTLEDEQTETIYSSVIHQLGINKNYYSLDGRAIDRINRTQILIEVDKRGQKTRKVIFIPQ